MLVTSETLFHFTTSLKNLQSILSKKFHLTYCQEKYTLQNETHDYYFPMISFCDIPLSLAKDQIDKYGSYAIGLTKEWGIRNNLNPIVYLETNSLLAQDIQEDLDRISNIVKVQRRLTIKHLDFLPKVQLELKRLAKTISDKSNDKDFNLLKERKEVDKLLEDALFEFKNASQITKYLKEIVDSKLNFFRYVKNYQGVLVRQNKTFKNYRFYDEREWRYVPAINDQRVESKLSKEQYRIYRGNGNSKPLIETVKLDFTSVDIKFLIVKSSKDIPRLIKSIQSIDNLAKHTNDAFVLTTKILTVEQLNNDF